MYHWLELSLSMRESRANIGHLFIIRIRDSTILVLLLWTHGSLTHTENEYNTVILTIWGIVGNRRVISDIPSSSLLSQTMTSIFTICGSRFFKIIYYLWYGTSRKRIPKMDDTQRDSCYSISKGICKIQHSGYILVCSMRKYWWWGKWEMRTISSSSIGCKKI